MVSDRHLRVKIFRNEHSLFGIDQVIRASKIDASGFFHNLSLNFFRDVYIIIFPPGFSFKIVSVTIIVTTICTSFMDE